MRKSPAEELSAFVNEFVGLEIRLTELPSVPRIGDGGQLVVTCLERGEQAPGLDNADSFLGRYFRLIERDDTFPTEWRAYFAEVISALGLISIEHALLDEDDESLLDPDEETVDDDEPTLSVSRSILEAELDAGCEFFLREDGSRVVRVVTLVHAERDVLAVRAKLARLQAELDAA